MIHNCMRRPGRAMLIGMLVAFAWLITCATPAAAAPRTPHTGSDNVTLAMANGTSFTYQDQLGGSPAPAFTATVVLAAKLPGNYFLTVSVQLDTGQSFANGFLPTTSDGITYTFAIQTDGTRITTGTRSAVASFFNPATKVTVQSSAISFTVNRATPQYTCGGPSYNEPVSPGQPITIQMAFSDPSPVDWQRSTYTVQFVGPSTVTYANLAPDASDAVSVPAPAQIGRYTQHCTFSGSTLFLPASAQSNPDWVLVSAKHHLGPVQLYSNPTTLVVRQKADLLFVFQPAPGLPVPTGYFIITLGSSSTQVLPLQSNGEQLVHLAPLPDLTGVTHLTVYYEADPEYDLATLTFPLTNPPIPGAGSGGGGTGGGGAPGTPTARSTTTPQPGSTASPSVGASAIGGPRQAPPTRVTAAGAANTALWWVLGLLGVVVVGGGVAGGIIVKRRTRPHAPVGATAITRWPPTTSPPGDASPPWQN